MRLDYLTIFPEFFDVLGISLLGKAVDNGIVDIHAHDLRTWTSSYPPPRARRFGRMTPRSCPMPIASSSAVDATRASTIASSTMPASTGAFMSSAWATTSSTGERWLRLP